MLLAGICIVFLRVVSGSVIVKRQTVPLATGLPFSALEDPYEPSELSDLPATVPPTPNAINVAYQRFLNNIRGYNPEGSQPISGGSVGSKKNHFPPVKPPQAISVLIPFPNTFIPRRNPFKPHVPMTPSIAIPRLEDPLEPAEFGDGGTTRPTVPRRQELLRAPGSTQNERTLPREVSMWKARQNEGPNNGISAPAFDGSESFNPGRINTSPSANTAQLLGSENNNADMAALQALITTYQAAQRNTGAGTDISSHRHKTLFSQLHDPRSNQRRFQISPVDRSLASNLSAQSTILGQEVILDNRVGSTSKTLGSAPTDQRHDTKPASKYIFSPGGLNPLPSQPSSSFGVSETTHTTSSSAMNKNRVVSDTTDQSPMPIHSQAAYVNVPATPQKTSTLNVRIGTRQNTTMPHPTPAKTSVLVIPGEQFRSAI